MLHGYWTKKFEKTDEIQWHYRGGHSTVLVGEGAIATIHFVNFANKLSLILVIYFGISSFPFIMEKKLITRKLDKINISNSTEKKSWMSYIKESKPYLRHLIYLIVFVEVALALSFLAIYMRPS
jgi:hypothetical protein